MAATTKRRRRGELGSTRELKSGRWEARYTDPTGKRRNVPGTFASKAEAVAALARVNVARADGSWQAPEATGQAVGEYAAKWLERRTRKLRPSTEALYRTLLAEFANAPVALDGRPFTLGDLPLNRLTPGIVEDWAIGVRETIRESEAARAGIRMTATQAARAWAIAEGLPVRATGRFSPDVLTAWQATGSPRPGTETPDVAAIAEARRVLASIEPIACHPAESPERAVCMWGPSLIGCE